MFWKEELSTDIISLNLENASSTILWDICAILVEQNLEKVYHLF